MLSLNDCGHLPDDDRVVVKGKFLYWREKKFYIKGVTYGTFAPRENDNQFPEDPVIEQDLKLMSEHGINCVRTYTVPPKFLLDTALAYDIKVMVGLPWEQHITFLDSKERKRDIVQRVRGYVESCGQHPAILCYAVGNEIPAGIVRWHGKEKIEKFLKELYQAVKSVDPDRLVTYVNFPTTEYLDLSFLDFDCFNVYLETKEKLGAYVQRLHNLSGDRPLVLAEIGLDSMRNGAEKQAEVLEWQIETIFGKGCAGMFVFAWTDEWWRGGHEIEDWDFGIVDRQRNPKPALSAVSKAMHKAPLPATADLPFFSVVVCSYKGFAYIRETLEKLLALDYPHFEVIVVNDGSGPAFDDIVKEYQPVRLISTENRGLSSARNTGMYAARGEIVAYIDDDAYPDPHWLHYLAYAYRTTDHGGIGGPNIVPPEDGYIATCVANAPGGPVHVLETDEIAEHIPGCNMSFRKEILMKIGGCDPVYRAAGDDVDLCWRVQQTGATIGFHPSAVVWHHRRNSLKAYWRQQKGYGKAEALLEAKWPEKYNSLGHLAWKGSIYGPGFTLPVKLKKDKVFFGTWGSALFQSVYRNEYGAISYLPLMPEWYLFMGAVLLAGIGGIWYAPLLAAWAVLGVALSLVAMQAIISAYKNTWLPADKRGKVRYHALIAVLHVVQPIARLRGRLQHGLTPWRRRGADFHVNHVLPFQRFVHWSESWRASEDYLSEIEQQVILHKSRVKRGSDYDRWDLEIRNGFFGGVRCLMSVEEHGAGKQYVRFKSYHRYWFWNCVIVLAVISSATWMILYPIVPALLVTMVLAIVGATVLKNCSKSMHTLHLAIKSLSEPALTEATTATPGKRRGSAKPVLAEEIVGEEVVAFELQDIVADLNDTLSQRQRVLES